MTVGYTTSRGSAAFDPFIIEPEQRDGAKGELSSMASRSLHTELQSLEGR